MALNRVNGSEDLYVGGVFGLRRAKLIEDLNITHVLSVIKYMLPADEASFRNIAHLSIDIDDMEDEDILQYMPRMVRFIERALYGEGSIAGVPTGQSRKQEDPDEISQAEEQLANITLTPAASSTPGRTKGAVLVHCAMGKSRSVTAVIAYLLWKHPHRFGRSDPTTPADKAVAQALMWVRQTRPVAEPNDGFMQQLQMWWEMGCPADSDDAIEREPAYQRWLYKREVEDAARIGRTPDWIRFEDEEVTEGKDAAGEQKDVDSGVELRCKKCRRVLATKPFVIPHQGRGSADCPHYFIEALSWMRPVLEEGELEGRLVCPNAKCSASVGRYTWKGFKCSCGDWVAPAFSLQRSRVDEVITSGKPDGSAATTAGRMAALGIRMPPGAGAAAPISHSGGRKENL
ncbi:protein-tyrosine phosphatase-like protein [Apodospora peruviana]|uniref:protein-tyrosine-phosphatase n=1 Tax=Apodospora peruviana TaxID=516989 RepID=A0AAE0HTM9_9PEZI|nr:protein-tyrosine phosphatase-like protein [Apodospora peruviana]